MGNAQDRWHIGPKFLTMPILHPCNLEEWYPSISIDWQVLVCGTERINHRTKMTYNRVSFDLKAPVTYLLVLAEVLCCIPNAMWTFSSVPLYMESPRESESSKDRGRYKSLCLRRLPGLVGVEIGDCLDLGVDS